MCLSVAFLTPASAPSSAFHHLTNRSTSFISSFRHRRPLLPATHPRQSVSRTHITATTSPSISTSEPAMSKYPNLFKPLSIGDLVLPNRIVMAPMTRGRAGPDYLANDMMATYYSQRASAGLLITEGTHTSLYGRGWYEAPEIYTQAHVDGWRKTTDAVHAAGGRIFCQLWHTGRASHSSFRSNLPGYEGDKALAVAPSALKRKFHGDGTQKYTPGGITVPIETPRALTLEEVKNIPAEFAHAAQCAKDAGFDGVEIHGANGYLIDEFLQSCSNVREDEYGGSFENRFRLLREVFEAVSKVFPSTRIGVRLSPNGTYNGMGAEDNREAFLYYAKQLSTFNIGYLHIMVGSGFVPNHPYGEPLNAKDFRQVFPGTIMANISYTAESGNAELESGNADLIAYGRPFMSNPDLVERFKVDHELVDPDFSTAYSDVENRPGEKGYIDFPTM